MYDDEEEVEHEELISVEMGYCVQIYEKNVMMETILSEMDVTITVR